MIASISVRLALCAVALLAAGCGGLPQVGDQPPSEAQLQRWAQCMNQHGVHATVKSDSSGSAVRVPVGNNGQPSSGQPSSGQQQVQAAEAACHQLMPNGFGPNRQPSAQELDQAAKYVQCVNEHGGDAQVAQDGGITEQPGPGGPAAEAQADQACQSLAPGGGH
jgi:hypothetical protein